MLVIFIVVGWVSIRCTPLLLIAFVVGQEVLLRCECLLSQLICYILDPDSTSTSVGC